jgi:D-aminopeptidase
VEEGAVGAGTGTVCFGFKGGIGTSSRILPEKLGGYTVGVLVQSNFGGVLQVNGVPVGQALDQYYLRNEIHHQGDGSCMIVVATDAPLQARNLKRLAKRAMLGLARTGGISANGSGDYVIAFSTDKPLRILNRSDSSIQSISVLRNSEISPLFLAVVEATEEAILNSLFTAESMEGFQAHKVSALPIDKVLNLMKEYHRVP